MKNLYIRIKFILRSHYYHYLWQRVSTGIYSVDDYHGLNRVKNIRDMFQKQKLKKEIQSGLVITPNLGIDLYTIDLLEIIQDILDVLSKVNLSKKQVTEFDLPNGYTLYYEKTHHIFIGLTNSRDEEVLDLGYNYKKGSFFRLVVYKDMNTHRYAFDIHNDPEIKNLKDRIEQVVVPSFNYCG